jgi:hypothetical protein
MSIGPAEFDDHVFPIFVSDALQPSTECTYWSRESAGRKAAKEPDER